MYQDDTAPPGGGSGDGEAANPALRERDASDDVSDDAVPHGAPLRVPRHAVVADGSVADVGLDAGDVAHDAVRRHGDGADGRHRRKSTAFIFRVVIRREITLPRVLRNNCHDYDVISKPNQLRVTIAGDFTMAIPSRY